MLTIEKLEKFGCDYKEGLNRCLNNESFYFKMIEKAMNQTSFNDLEKALKQKQLEEAFYIAHSLKGVFGNLSITPIYNLVVELTELLREKKDMDYSPYLNKLNILVNEFKEIINS